MRKKLEKLDELLREKRMTIEVIEEENTAAHRKSLEYKEIVTRLIDQQLEMERELGSMKKLAGELNRLRERHSLCRTDDQVRDFVATEIDKLLERQRLKEVERDGLSPGQVTRLQDEVTRLRDIVVKLAITAKSLAEVCAKDFLRQIYIHL